MEFYKLEKSLDYRRLIGSGGLRDRYVSTIMGSKSAINNQETNMHEKIMQIKKCQENFCIIHKLPDRFFSHSELVKLVLAHSAKVGFHFKTLT